MQNNRKLFFTFALLSDIILIIVSFYFVRFATGTLNSVFLPYENFALLISLIILWIYSSLSTNLYEGMRSESFAAEAVLIFKNVSIQFAASIVISFFLKEHVYARLFVLLYNSLLLLLLFSEKFVLRRMMIYLRKKGRNLRNLLIIGAGKTGMNVYAAYKNNIVLGYNTLGFLDDETKPYLNGEYLGKINEIEKVIMNYHVDNVLITLPEFKKDEIDKVIQTCKMHSIKIRKIPEYFSSISGAADLSRLMIEKFPMITVSGEKLNEFSWKIIKEICDVLISLVFLIVIASWLFPLIGLIIKLTSKGPVIFKQERWGKDDKSFILYKFRTMYEEPERTNMDTDSLRTMKGDPRITTFGKFLRKMSLDETPQFWNVLKGDMAVVGPRPLPSPMNVESANKIDLYVLRHIVKPGLTGWAQVNGYRGGISIKKHIQERFQYDLWYIENWSFWLDVEIIFLTIIRTLKGDPNAY
jgi:putative colanic acid biosynthesis UDP-glucose lipid carrier transferase